jgi:outer membrane protein OmpA-like peptidoglycan-associated protein
MAKGIKKIVWTGEGKVYNTKKGSIPGQLMVVAPSEDIWFKIGEWEAGTTEQDKKKDIKWAIFNPKGVIDFQKTIPSHFKYGFKIPRKLCGPYLWYVEASWSGNFDGKSGLKVRGESPAKIVDSRWSQNEGGPDVRKTYQFSYGELIWLRLFTEGLNGYDNVEVRVFRRLRSAMGLWPKDDEVTRKIYRVSVINGEINLKIPNTYSWYQSMSDRAEVEEFYVRVVHPVTGKYIEDTRKEPDTAHARFLRIKDKVKSQVVEKPQNRTPVTIYQPDKNEARFELCKFEQINVTEEGAKPVLVFDNGKGVRNIKDKREKNLISIVFKFDSTELLPESLKQLNNILQFLLEHRYSTIQLDGFACVIGKQNHNNVLSENRAKTVREFFIKGKLDPDRIKAAGHGEVNPTDDKMGRDNIKYKNEYEYTSNRRVDISFEYYGHNAETINYLTILGSTPKNILIQPVNFDTKACFDRKKHDKIISLYNLNEKKAQKEGSITIPAVSAIGKHDSMPIQYIWPMNKATLTNIYSSANEYLVHVHSCRYFSVENNPTVLLKVYPDIKWDFHFFLNLSNQLSVKWQNLSPAEHTEMQKKAGKIGAEKRWSQTEIDFGVMFKAQWDKSGDKYGATFDATFEHEAKIKWLYNIFGSLKEFSKAVTDTTKGKLTKTRLGKALPFKLEMKPPNFCLGAVWFLEKPVLAANKGKIGTNVKFYFKAEPLIGVTLNIDLLSMLVTSAGTAVGNPQAGMIFNEVRDWLAEDGHNITFKMYIDLLITGTIQGAADINFNTVDLDPKLDASIDVTLSAELQAGLEIEGKIVVIGVRAYAKGEMKATGKAAITFGHGLKYDDKGMYYRPKLMFDGLIVTFVIKAEVGISIKRGIFKGDRNINLADYDKKANLIPEFDVIENLEKYAGVDANIPLFRKSNT